ncbi:MAG: cyclophane-forming radical SAM/SPASM peptide maturase GrrM/OscB [Pseudomonadota bacterium]
MVAPTSLLVLQPTPFCNLDCTYCYLPGRDSAARMSDETLERVAEVVFARGRLAPQITVVWHAGEPCVLPSDWYRRAFATLEARRPASVEVVHSFQTNATLLDAGWLDLFARSDVRVGVSLDGPQSLHDLHRRTRRGEGSFARVMRGVGQLRAAGIPFHVIAVLSLASLEDPEGLARFFIDEGLDQICLNVEEIDGINRESSLTEGVVETRFANFIKRFFREIETADPQPWVRELDFCRQAVCSPPTVGNPGNHQVDPLAILSVDVEGRVSTFSPELLGLPNREFANFLFGSLDRLRSPKDLLRNPTYERAATAIEAGRRACRQSCEYFRFCGGGAPANKLGEAGRLDAAETLFCRLTVKTLLTSYLAYREERYPDVSSLARNQGRVLTR